MIVEISPDRRVAIATMGRTLGQGGSPAARYEALRHKVNILNIEYVLISTFMEQSDFPLVSITY